MKHAHSFRAALLGAVFSTASTMAFAQTAPAPAAAAAPAAPAPVALIGPPMTQPLALNTATPLSIDMAALGKWYVGGVATGLAYGQTNATGLFSSDNGGGADVSNAQVFIQKSDGMFQFYAQLGLYSYLGLGSAYLNATKFTDNTYGPAPVVFGKIAPFDGFSISAGKMITLIGAEYTWSFENYNIERGLLTNIEPGVGRAVQANYATGPLSFALQWGDGFYSERFNWLTGNATWTIDPSNALALTIGGNLGHTNTNTFATPGLLNNTSIYNVIYTYNDGPLTISPLLQYTHVSSNVQTGVTESGNTYGITLLGNYNIDDHWSLSGRLEYLYGDGNKNDPFAPNLTFYGAGSKAYTATITPTYKWDKYFVRGDVSYTGLTDYGTGLGFGSNYDKSSQIRGVVETGVLF